MSLILQIRKLLRLDKMEVALEKEFTDVVGLWFPESHKLVTDATYISNGCLEPGYYVSVDTHHSHDLHF